MEGALVIGLILNIISMIACPIIGGNKGRSVVEESLLQTVRIRHNTGERDDLYLQLNSLSRIGHYFVGFRYVFGIRRFYGKSL